MSESCGSYFMKASPKGEAVREWGGRDKPDPHPALRGHLPPKGEGLELFYIVSGAFTLNIVKMLWMTPRTARQRAMRPCCTVPSASRMRQAL